jgi:hypothetical protein
MGVGREAEGVGELAALRLACISLKAATETRCEESDAMLSPLGRAGGIGKEFEDKSSELVGESVRTCRKDLRLKDASISSCEGGGAALDFVLCRAQAKIPPDFLEAGGGAMIVLELS